MTPLIELKNLHREYRLPRQKMFGPAPTLAALRGIDLQLAEGESFGIVGESGCGKSTLARTVAGLESPSAGQVLMRGEDIHQLKGDALRAMRRHIQMVFQDPYGSLDPRQKVARIVAEPLVALGTADEKRGLSDTVRQVLEAVGLKPSDADKFPHEFSGGQRQRVAIARALITKPHLIIADEAVSALDVSIQAQVLNLMTQLRRDHGLAYLFISHDLSVVHHVTERLAVMYHGRVVEQGPTEAIFARPTHPYTVTLLNAVPRPTANGHIKKRVIADIGETPKTGCPFAPRCPRVVAACGLSEPTLREIDPGHFVACDVI